MIPEHHERTAHGQRVSLDEFLDAIDAVRASYGACTYAALAGQLGISTPATHARVRRLVRDGLVTVSELPGSIRRARGGTVAAERGVSGLESG